jgi:hypothetical protein
MGKRDSPSAAECLGDAGEEIHFENLISGEEFEEQIGGN